MFFAVLCILPLVVLVDLSQYFFCETSEDHTTFINDFISLSFIYLSICNGASCMHGP